MPSQEVLDIIKEAIVILETEGWAQGKYYIPRKGYSVMGAVAKAAGYNDYKHPFKTHHVPEKKDIAFSVIEYIGKELSTSYVDTRWNDHPFQTKDNVISVLTALGEGRKTRQFLSLTPNEYYEKS